MVLAYQVIIFQIPLALTMPNSNNFRLNGASGQFLELLTITIKVIFDRELARKVLIVC